MRAFVTGINGFAGSHLASALLKEKFEVRGVSEEPGDRGMLPEGVLVDYADIREGASLGPLIADFEPDVVFHLAGFASPRMSLMRAASCIAVNALGTANVLEAVYACAPNATAVIVTTIHTHAGCGDKAITEESPMVAVDPYTISKVCAHHLCRFYYERREVKVIEARPTNHFGPGQRNGFVVADFACQIARIRAGLARPEIVVGNLDVARDILYVEDVVEAYILLSRKGKPGEAYCIASGQSVQIKEILDTLLEFSGIEVEVTVNPKKSHPDEPPTVVASADKLERDTGWKPKTTLRDGLRRTLDYWYDTVGSNQS